jgi:serine/threonine protein kinase
MQLSLSQISEHVVKLHYLYRNAYQPRNALAPSSHIFVLMELAQSDLFSTVKTTHGLSEAECRRLVQQIVSVVRVMHWNGLVHRDIKPENVLLDGCSNAKLADFGFVCAAGASTKPKFSSAFAAPETVLSVRRVRMGLTPLPAAPAADMWSLGVTIFAMLSATYPFVGRMKTTRDENRILSGDFRFEAKTLISDDAKRVIRALLQVDPAKRMTIEELASDRWLASNDTICI